MFFNQKRVEENKRLLDKLQEKVKESHKVTFDRVTKDFKSPQDFSRAQYVGAKFKEAGFGYPTNDNIIRRCAGPERSMQTFLQYGGKNLTQAYVSKFVKQYENSRQRLHDLQFDTRDEYRAAKDTRDDLEEKEKKRREEIQKLFGIGSAGVSPLKQTKPDTWDKVFKRKNNKKYGDGGGDDDDDDDDDDGDDKPGRDRLRKMLRRELERFKILKGPSKPVGLNKDDDDDNDEQPGDGSGGPGDEDDDDDEEIATSTNDLLHRDPIKVDTPREVFNSNAYAERSEYLDPITGRVIKGYDNIGASSLNTMLDTTKNIMINVSVDRHRARTAPFLKKNNRRLKKRVYKFADKRNNRITGVVNQFSEILDTKPTEAEEDTLGTILASQAHSRADTEEADLDWDTLTPVYQMSDDMPPRTPHDGANAVQQQKQQKQGSEGDEDEESDESRQQRYQPADFLIRQDGDEESGGDPSTSADGLGLGIRLRPSASSMSNILSILNDLGYDEEQSSAFILNDDIDYGEFAGLSVDQKVSTMKKVLSDANLNEDPAYSDLTADEIISANLTKKDRLTKGTTPNLLSRDFAVNNDLDSITQLSSTINSASTLNIATPFRPGSDDDPYQLAFTNVDDDDDDGDDDAPAAAVSHTAIPPTEIVTAESVLPSNSRIVELQEQFQEQHEVRLNSFVDGTPLQQQNAVSMNRFLTQVAREEPLEVEREKVRRNEEVVLKEFLRKNYNPNRVSTRDAVSFGYGDYDLTFERHNLESVDAVEEKVSKNSDSEGRANVERTLRNAMDSIRENEESTLGGFLETRTGSSRWETASLRKTI